MNSQEDTYASSLAKLNNKEVMLGSKKKVYKQKLTDKTNKLISVAWQRYIDAGRSQPSTPNDVLKSILGEYQGMIRLRNELKLTKI